MSSASENPPAEFDVRAAMFPLPNCVVFPHVLQPLHIFEPRYRHMTADALAGDRLLAMALLKPAPVADLSSLEFSEAAPPVFPVVCLGRITAEEHLPDGRYFLVFRGESRAMVVGEDESELPYRVARLKLLTDSVSAAEGFSETDRREELLRWARQLEATSVIDQMLTQAGERANSLAFTTDMLAYLLGGEPIEVQSILATTDVRTRSEMVLRRLQNCVEGQKQLKSSDRPFPPPFSSN